MENPSGAAYIQESATVRASLPDIQQQIEHDNPADARGGFLSSVQQREEPRPQSKRTTAGKKLRMNRMSDAVLLAKKEYGGIGNRAGNDELRDDA